MNGAVIKPISAPMVSMPTSWKKTNKPLIALDPVVSLDNELLSLLRKTR